MAKTACIAGATGLVGGELLKQALALDDYGHITVLVRKELPIRHPKLRQVVVDFERLWEYRELLGADDVFCCLGTTIKIAKTQEAFERVDRHYPLALARLAKEQGCARFLIISAMGANPQSSIFYNRVKGTLEAELRELRLPELHIFRPSLLLGDRGEFRLGERLAAALMRATAFAMAGPLRPYRAIHARTVAWAMLRAARSGVPGTHVYASNRIAELGDSRH
ncbi:oxidoreductase [Paenibacillus aestuarii]|uniref:Oxidoreductase n=1 Tax=Paenibacillus aestuarii TaxID=516965 RepID=A0ABW0KCN0_9BACL|nr:oxidoreductase [Paenibacillus aestuarii]